MISAMLSAVAGADPLDHVVQHDLWTLPADLGPLTPDGVITLLSDHVVMMILAAVLLMLALPPLVRRRSGKDEVNRHVPSGSANFIETICQYLRKEVAEPALGEHTDRFIKFVWTTFFFILTMNLLGMIPLNSVTPLLGTHIGGTATGNLWITGTMAALAMGMWIVNGIRLAGGDYLAHFNPSPRKPLVLFVLLSPLLILIEVFGVFAKTFALAVRLFANMLAGHLLLAQLVSFILTVGTAIGAFAGLGLAALVIPASVAVGCLEIFVAFLQAFIFTFLTVLFLGQAIIFHHGEEHAEAPAH